MVVVFHRVCNILSKKLMVMKMVLRVIMNLSANHQIRDKIHRDLAKPIGGGGGEGSNAHQKRIKFHLLFPSIMNRIFQFHIYCSCSISR